MQRLLRLLTALCLLILFAPQNARAQQSVARRWNELLIQSIREDFARPPVHARNLFHLSIAMYDAWAVYDTVARPFFLGNTWGTYTAQFWGVPQPPDVEAARREAISYAAYRLLFHRFQSSPNAGITLGRYIGYMNELGYNINYTSQDYLSGKPAALGNYIAASLINMGLQDGSNEAFNYAITDYLPLNPPLTPTLPGNPGIQDPNRWQPLNIPGAVDQNGNPIPSIQRFQSPEWGRVTPFALTPADCDTFLIKGVPFYIFHDPGPPPQLDTTTNGDPSEFFKWNYALCSVWSAHLTPEDTTLWDISPASLGNNQAPLPTTLAEYQSFYHLIEGGTVGDGHATNPHTGLPYTPQWVKRGDYTRVLAQFWADGPNSETPPGHWFAIFNKVMDHPAFVRQFNGRGDTLSPLEYEVKAYLILGGAVHDAAISAWSIKGRYDSGRPISILRYMADKGQCTDPNLPRYHQAGLPLIPGYIESVMAGDPLAGVLGGNIGKIKVNAFLGPLAVNDPATQIAGVDWILAQNWWPYQRSTFVTPPFAGYISGHSTYSRAAAEALTLLTGDAFFPGGVGEFKILANSGFLGMERGPSTDVTLQWATYRDASDQTSLSRIWGGIHPPVDDIPGRIVGLKCGTAAYHLAKTYFYPDLDQDGFVSLEDCDDHNPNIYPGAPEICDNADNDCNGLTDEGFPVNTYYADTDADGYGQAGTDTIFICQTTTPNGYATNNLDCDDTNAAIFPGAPEMCDDIDNDCNGFTDDNIPLHAYYLDADGDGFGRLSADSVVTCFAQPPAGYAANALDCDDTNAAIFPGAPETCDNADNDCNGLTDDGIPFFTYYPDADADGFGAVGVDSLFTCTSMPPTGYVTNALDCDDTRADIFPGAPEICDNADNDCNGLTDDALPLYTYYPDADADGFGRPSADSVATCFAQPPAGYVSNALDCDDTNAAIFPGAPEICDNADNDCNGLTDDALPLYTYYPDADADGFGRPSADSVATCFAQPPVGYVSNALDCDDTNAAIFPGAPEICDNADNDCNGLTDDALPLFTYFPDTDGDGFGASTADTLLTCINMPPMGYVTSHTDCNDSNAAVFPNALEILDGLDNDCNGLVDDISSVREPDLVWSAYPNPVRDQLLIESPYRGSLLLEVFDVSGQCLRSESVHNFGGQHVVDFALLPSGVYVLKAITPEGSTGATRVLK